MFLGKFDGPDSGARTQVDDGVGGLGEGGVVKSAVEGKAPEVMLKVCAIRKLKRWRRLD